MRSTIRTWRMRSTIRTWRLTIRTWCRAISTHIRESGHCLLRNFLKLIWSNSVLHAIHGLSILKAKRTAVDLIDKLPRVNKLKSIHKTSKRLLSKPGIGIYLFVVFINIFIVVQSFYQSVKKIIYGYFTNMTVL